MPFRLVVRIFLLIAMLCRLPAAAQETYSCGLPKTLQYAVQATGRSTGHLLTVTAYNPGAEPLSIPAVEVLIPGKDSTQALICRIPATQVPGSSLKDIVLRGIGISFRRPALKLSSGPAPIDRWIACPGNLPALQIEMVLPDVVKPVDTAITKTYLHFPGTPVPIGFIPEVHDHLDAAAPLLFALNAHTRTTYDRLWDAGRIQLPFARDQVYQIGLQQVSWYIFSILENDPYTKEDLRQSLIAQTEKDLWRTFEEMPASMQSYIHQSADEIWAMIRMIARESGLE